MGLNKQSYTKGLVMTPRHLTDTWLFLLQTLLYFSPLGIGLIGNFLVVFVILSRRHMRTTVNLSLLNLAVCDIIFVSICVPFVAYHYAADTWTMGVLSVIYLYLYDDKDVFFVVFFFIFSIVIWKT